MDRGGKAMLAKLVLAAATVLVALNLVLALVRGKLRLHSDRLETDRAKTQVSFWLIVAIEILILAALLWLLFPA
jgi:hypothetical protein